MHIFNTAYTGLSTNFATVLQAFITSYTVFVIAFGLYFWLLYSSKKVTAWFEKKVGYAKATIFYVGLEKFTGFVLMLVLPLIVLSWMGLFDAAKLGAEFTNVNRTLMWWAIFGAVVVIVNFIRAGKKNNYAIYPHIRAENWTLSLLGYYVSGWAIYLLGYEFLFRGVLFFAGMEVLPLWLNITINCILYALAHLPKGRAEILASLPFGAVLCLISYDTGNFWAAWLIHLTLALSNSLVAIKANPEMKFKLNRF